MQLDETKMPSSSKVPITSGKEEVQTTQTTKRKSLENKREELLTRCINVSREPGKEAKINSFAVFVSEMLENLDPRSRLIAEKRIADILFEMEMNMYESRRPSFGSNDYQVQMNHTLYS